MDRHGRQIVDGQRGRGLSDEGVVGLGKVAGSWAAPDRIVETGLLPAAVQESAVDVLGELGVVADHAGAAIGGADADPPGVVGSDGDPPAGFGRDDQLGEHPLAIVGAVPDAVDEALVVDVDGDDVATRDERAGNVPGIDVVAEGIGRRGPLADELAVDVQVVVVVGGDGQACGGRLVGQVELLAGQHVHVSQGGVVLGQVDRLGLLVQEGARREGRETRVLYPACLPGTVHNRLRCGRRQIARKLMAQTQAANEAIISAFRPRHHRRRRHVHLKPLTASTYRKRPWLISTQAGLFFEQRGTFRHDAGCTCRAKDTRARRWELRTP